MITVNLQGGLGNQLFQIATAEALARENNDVAIFNLNTCSTNLQGNKAEKYKTTLYKNLNTLPAINDNIFLTYNETTYTYTPIPYQNNIVLNGYFQSEKYFKNHREHIIGLLQFNSEIINNVKLFLNSISNRCKVSLHVRRGDYLHLNHIYKIQTLDYYNKAMSYFKDCDFIIVSDDINWVKNNIKGSNIYYSEASDDLFDLALMSNCDHHIISNSTFAWWGAWLNVNENKTIICPTKWFEEASGLDEKDIICQTWITL
jgi:hypothetical protein